jgi:DcmR-like sensory protein
MDTLHGVEPGEHFAHFYEDPEALYRGLIRYVLEALSLSRHSVLAITHARADVVRARLQASGVDLARAATYRDLVFLIVDDLLPQMRFQGQIDAVLFERLVGDRVRRAAESQRGAVYVFEEFGDVLWQRGDVAGILRLEEFWGRLQLRTPLVLYCAFHLGERPARVDELGRILESHGAAFGLERSSGGIRPAGFGGQLTQLTPHVAAELAQALAAGPPSQLRGSVLSEPEPAG